VAAVGEPVEERGGEPASSLKTEPPGTGKTHTAIGLGLAACRRGKRVRFITVTELVTELAEAQAEHRLSRLEGQLDRIDLLVCDEFGFLRLDADQAQLLWQAKRWRERWSRPSRLVGHRRQAGQVSVPRHHPHPATSRTPNYRWQCTKLPFLFSFPVP
jgi:hypothetical protein